LSGATSLANASLLGRASGHGFSLREWGWEWDDGYGDHETKFPMKHQEVNPQVSGFLDDFSKKLRFSKFSPRFCDTKPTGLDWPEASRTAVALSSMAENVQLSAAPGERMLI